MLCILGTTRCNVAFHSHVTVCDREPEKVLTGSKKIYEK